MTAGRRADEPPTDAERFEAFVREYQDMVFATAVRLLGNATEAEDIAQTVFLRAFERFAEVGTSPTAAGWLKTVATNLCLNHLSRYRARWQSAGELGGDGESEHGEPVPRVRDTSPLDAVEQTDRAEHLERALRALPDHQRVPLVLFHFEELSYQEIASQLKVSLGKVKTDIHRARERLRNELSDLYESR